VAIDYSARMKLDTDCTPIARMASSLYVSTRAVANYRSSAMSSAENAVDHAAGMAQSFVRSLASACRHSEVSSPCRADN
jgi:hypothetical protein